MPQPVVRFPGIEAFSILTKCSVLTVQGHTAAIDPFHLVFPSSFLVHSFSNDVPRRFFFGLPMAAEADYGSRVLYAS